MTAEGQEVQMDKGSTLQFLLEEKYGVIHTIRERVQGIVLAAVGGMTASAAWCASHDPGFSAAKRVVISILFVVVGGVVFLFLADLSRAFKSTWRVVTEIETILGCYRHDHFGPGVGTIYPRKWQDGGRGGGDGRFFCWSYVFVALASVASVVLLWL